MTILSDLKKELGEVLSNYLQQKGGAKHLSSDQRSDYELCASALQEIGDVFLLIDEMKALMKDRMNYKFMAVFPIVIDGNRLRKMLRRVLNKKSYQENVLMKKCFYEVRIHTEGKDNQIKQLLEALNDAKEKQHEYLTENETLYKENWKLVHRLKKAKSEAAKWRKMYEEAQQSTQSEGDGIELQEWKAERHELREENEKLRQSQTSLLLTLQRAKDEIARLREKNIALEAGEKQDKHEGSINTTDVRLASGFYE